MKKTVFVLLPALALCSAAYAQSTNLSGFYWGAQAGVAENFTKISDRDWWYSGTQNDSNLSTRPLLGLKFGYDGVNNSRIYGYFAEGTLTGLNSQKEVRPSDPMYSAGSKINALGSLRGKYGIVSDKLAVFATGGLALADIEHKFDETDGYDAHFRGNGKELGYVFGAGTSYALTQNTSLGVDLSRYIFGSKTHKLVDSNGNPVGISWNPAGYSWNMKDRVDVLNVSYTMKF